MSLRTLRWDRRVAYTAVALVAGVTAIAESQTYRVATVAATYYVSPGGNDSNSGLSPSLPFRHIQTCASHVQPGGTCLLEAGTYHETVTPAHDGTADQPITFQAYQGAVATIDGADAITTWVPSGGGPAYSATVALPASGYQDAGFLANQLLVDGVMLQEARFPADTSSDLLNPSDGYAQAGTTDTHIADSSLTFPAGSLVGATVHIRGTLGWSAQTKTVQANDTGSLDFPSTAACSAGSIAATTNTRWFVTGLPSTRLLTYAGAWAYAPVTHTLFLRLPGDVAPTGHTIEAKQRTNAFDLSGRAHIIVDGLSLVAATISTTVASHDISLRNLTITYPSHYETLPVYGPANDCPYGAHVLDSGIVLSGTNLELSGSTIGKSAGNGVAAIGSAVTVTDNLITSIDYMGGYAAPIFAYPNQGDSITRNTMRYAGRDGIHLLSTTLPASSVTTTIAYNEIDHFLEMTQDGGGIYGCCAIDGTRVVVDHNWSHDSLAGTELVDAGTMGASLYMDNAPTHFLLHHNVGWNTQVGIEVNANGVSAAGNLLYNNTMDRTIPTCYTIGPGGGDVSGMVVRNNICGSSGISVGAAVADHNLFGDAGAYVSFSGHNYMPSAGSKALDAGVLIAGITPAGDLQPDTGAVDHSDPDTFVPGCLFNVTACADPATPGLIPH